MTGTQAYHHSLDFVLEREGGLVFDPRDPGGLTNLGISFRWLRTIGLAGDIDGDGDVDAADIRAITRADAELLYHRHFWSAVGADMLPNRLACVVFDTAVNCGVGRAARLLQRSLNTAFDSGLAEDGVIGPKTVRAVTSLRLPLTGESQICDRYLLERTRYYLEICADKKRLRAFLRGWLSRVCELDIYVRRVFA